MKGRRDADGLRCPAAIHTGRQRRSEEKICSTRPWRRRLDSAFSPEQLFGCDWFNLLIGLIGLERDWWLHRCYVVRGFLGGRWIAFSQLTPRETKFHPDLDRIPLTDIFGYEQTVDGGYDFAVIMILKLSSHGWQLIKKRGDDDTKRVDAYRITFRRDWSRK